jgi:hypothetical protein
VDGADGRTQDLLQLYTLRESGNKTLRRISGLGEIEVTEGWRKVYSNEREAA